MQRSLRYLAVLIHPRTVRFLDTFTNGRQSQGIPQQVRHPLTRSQPVDYLIRAAAVPLLHPRGCRFHRPTGGSEGTRCTVHAVLPQVLVQHRQEAPEVRRSVFSWNGNVTGKGTNLRGFSKLGKPWNKNISCLSNAPV